MRTRYACLTPTTGSLPRITSSARQGSPITEPGRDGELPHQATSSSSTRRMRRTICCLAISTQTRGGVAVERSAGLLRSGFDASPNHHELALRYAFSDNFSPRAVRVVRRPPLLVDWSKSTTENEETHWLTPHGGKRQDSGDDPGASSRTLSWAASDSRMPTRRRSRMTFNEQGGIMLHLESSRQELRELRQRLRVRGDRRRRGGDPDRCARARQRADGEGHPR